jgi:hypothetical protein
MNMMFIACSIIDEQIWSGREILRSTVLPFKKNHNTTHKLYELRSQSISPAKSRTNSCQRQDHNRISYTYLDLKLTIEQEFEVGGFRIGEFREFKHPYQSVFSKNIILVCGGKYSTC